MQASTNDTKRDTVPGTCILKRTIGAAGSFQQGAHCRKSSVPVILGAILSCCQLGTRRILASKILDWVSYMHENSLDIGGYAYWATLGMRSLTGSNHWAKTTAQSRPYDRLYR